MLCVPQILPQNSGITDSPSKQQTDFKKSKEMQSKPGIYPAEEKGLGNK